MASVRKRNWMHKDEEGSSWQVSWTDLGGKRRSKQFKMKKDADRYRTKVETEMHEGIHTPDATSITVAQAYQKWMEDCERRWRAGDNMSRECLDSYRYQTRKHLLPFLGNVKLSKLTALVVQDWVDQIAYDPQNPRGQTSIKRTVSCLALMISHAQRKGLIATNVVKMVKPRLPNKRKERIPIPTKDEIRLILNKASGRGRAILYTAIFTGMRRGELFALKWENVKFDARVIQVRGSIDRWFDIGPTKTVAGVRDIPISRNLEMMLKEWRLSSGPDPSDAVFPKQRGGGHDAGHNFWHNEWKPFMQRIGLADESGRPKYHFHALRHVAASLFIEQGLPPKRIQTVMGHASITMTFDNYGHLFQDDTDMHAALENIERDLLG